MDRKDFKNILSEAFGKYDKKSKKFLKDVIEKNNKFLVKKIKREVREEFSRFVDVSIIPQFETLNQRAEVLNKRTNDMDHRLSNLEQGQDTILRTLVKHEDRFDHLGQRQDKILKVLEKHGEILGKHGDQLERIEAKLE